MAKLTPKKRCVFRLGGSLLAAMLVCAGLIVGNVRRAGTPIYPDAAACPTRPVAIVFGAGYSPRGLSAMLQDRVQTGVDLYQAGKVRKLLMTGDNGHFGYNEPDVMKGYAVRQGVPAADVVCDYAGFRTYDSLYRARDIFGVRQAILVSQRYHLPRALFVARHLGLTVIGVAADRRVYREQTRDNLREVFSVQKAWWDAYLLHPRPAYLGKPEPLLAEKPMGIFSSTTRGGTLRLE